MKTQAQHDAWKRWVERNRDDMKLRAKEWRAKNPARLRGLRERWERTYPERALAGQAVRIAVANGVLLRQPCHICGEAAEAHHASYAYDMWLLVTWLCKKHHRQVHAKPAKIREPIQIGQAWTDEMVERAAAMRNSGMKWRDVGAAFGVGGGGVRWVLLNRGVPLKRIHRWHHVSRETSDCGGDVDGL